MCVALVSDVLMWCYVLCGLLCVLVLRACVWYDLFWCVCCCLGVVCFVCACSVVCFVVVWFVSVLLLCLSVDCLCCLLCLGVCVV